MNTLKDIFVSYEIAQKLKEIGFDEPCLFYSNGNKYLASAPTWEQVKKWFREKGYESNVRAYFGCYYGTIGESEDIQLEQEKTYEEAQEKLILKLIEIYKNGKN